MPIASPESTAFRRGPGGRPTREEAERRHRVLLETATRLFLERGLDRVSMDEIARQTRVAKRFIYARYTDKGELFAAAVERLIEERVTPLQSFEVTDEPIESALFKFGKELLDLALKPEHLAVYRTLVIEAPRFPSLGKLDSERSRQRGFAAILRVLTAYARRGEIELRDPEVQAELFGILVVRGAQHRALIVGRDEPAQEERRLHAAIRLFLDGCRPARRQA
jgi:TetR/AcrR family transcriptional regulator, mexJK operon transcriptional repressor